MLKRWGISFTCSLALAPVLKAWPPSAFRVQVFKLCCIAAPPDLPGMASLTVAFGTSSYRDIFLQCCFGGAVFTLQSSACTSGPSSLGTWPFLVALGRGLDLEKFHELSA